MWVQDMQNYEMAKKAIDHSIETLGVEYLDLYLLHQAMKDYFSAWRAMEDAYKEGKLRAIGVSNFYPHVLTNFCETVAIRPMVNQIEMHPYFTQEPALKVMEEYQVVPEAWAPLGGGRHNPFDNEMVKEIAAAHRKDGRTGCSTLECTARRCGHSEIGSQDENRREFSDLGFYTDRRGNAENQLTGSRLSGNCGKTF